MSNQKQLLDASLPGEIVQLPWIAGPCAAPTRGAFVSFTDVRSSSPEDLAAIAELGTRLARTWPVMQGAVGLWLWAKPAELRSGSVSIWVEPADLRRFIRWAVHAEIMAEWRGRVALASARWEASRADPNEVWTRAQDLIRRPHGVKPEDRVA